MEGRPSATQQRVIDAARRKKLSASTLSIGCAAFDDPTAREHSTASQMKNPWESEAMAHRSSGTVQREAQKARRMKLSGSTLSIGCDAFDDVGARGKSTASGMTSPWKHPSMANRASVSDQQLEQKARRMKLSASTLHIGSAQFDDPTARLHSTASQMTDPWSSAEMADRPSGSAQQREQKARMKKLSASTLAIGCPAFDDAGARGKSTASGMTSPWKHPSMANRPSGSARQRAQKARRTKLSASTLHIGSAQFDDPTARLHSTASQMTNPWTGEAMAERPSGSALHRENVARRKKLSGTQWEFGCPAYDDPTARGKSTASGMTSPWEHASMANRSSPSTLRTEQKARKMKLSSSTLSIGCDAFDDPSAREHSTASQMKNPWQSDAMAHRASGTVQRAAQKARRMKLSGSTLSIGCEQFDDPTARERSTASDMKDPWSSSALANRPSASRKRADDKARRTKLSASTLAIGCPAFDDPTARLMSTAAQIADPWLAMPANRPSFSAQRKAQRARKTKLSASQFELGSAQFDDPSARYVCGRRQCHKLRSLSRCRSRLRPRANCARALSLSFSTPASPPLPRLHSTASRVLNPWNTTEMKNRQSWSARKREDATRRERLAGTHWSLANDEGTH
jgi:hypothetical protein